MEPTGTSRKRARLSYGPDPIDRHVGKRLRLARTLAGLNQSKLGEAIGVSFQAVQKYEQASHRISASRLFRAAQVLECPIEFFFENAEEQSPAEGPFFTTELELIRALRKIGNVNARLTLMQLIRQVGLVRGSEDESQQRNAAG